MTLDEAIKDPKRPLSMSPRDWMLSVEAELVEDNDLTNGTVERLVPEQQEVSESTKKENGWLKIDLGIDQIIEGCKILEKGIFEVNRMDLNKSQRTSIDYIDDIYRSAIIPYMAEIVNESEKIK